MFGLEMDQLVELARGEPGHGFVQSILLLLIWLNVRSLKNMLSTLEVSHNNRLNTLETGIQNHESRILVLEKH